MLFFSSMVSQILTGLCEGLRLRSSYELLWRGKVVEEHKLKHQMIAGKFLGQGGKGN